jgi:hypothetical protein
MNKKRLQALLDREISIWSAKSFEQLATEVRDIVSYERGEGADFHQFEVQLLEHTESYVHVCVSVDDGHLLRSVLPVTRSFIVHRDGRREI